MVIIFLYFTQKTAQKREQKWLRMKQKVLVDFFFLFFQAITLAVIFRI